MGCREAAGDVALCGRLGGWGVLVGTGRRDPPQAGYLWTSQRAVVGIGVRGPFGRQPSWRGPSRGRESRRWCLSPLRTAPSTRGWPACLRRSPRSRSSLWGLLGGSVSACDPEEGGGVLFATQVEPGGGPWGCAEALPDAGALGRWSVCARVLPGEAVLCSRDWEECKRPLRGVLLSGGECGGCSIISGISTAVGHVGGLPCAETCVSRGLWVAAGETG